MKKGKIKFLKKKALSIVLVVAFIFTIVQPVTLNVSATMPTDYWIDSGNYDTSWYNTIDTSFTLTTAQQLAGLAVLNNSWQNPIDFAGKTIIIVADIDLTGHLWTPIGNFKGTFDGKRYDISNIQINDSSLYDQGLFGVNNGTIQNVNITSGTIIGKSRVGGIVASNSGTVKECSNSATVSGVDYVGGITGYINVGKVVTNCYNTGRITGTSSYVGGVIGSSNGGTVTSCYNTGEVNGGLSVGGVVGINNNMSGTILQNSYNTGKVTGTDKVGGVVGYNWNASIVKNCYNIGIVAGGGSYVGGVAGQNNETVKDCYYYGHNIGIGGTGQDTIGQTTKFAKIKDNPVGVGKYTTVTENTVTDSVLGSNFAIGFSDEYSSSTTNATFEKVGMEKRITGVLAGTTNITGTITITQNKLTATGFTGAITTINNPIYLPLTVDNGIGGVDVIKSTPTISLGATPTALVVGDNIQLTATIIGGTRPSGVVNFKSGSTLIGSTSTIINGVATMNCIYNAIEGLPIIAEYTGDIFNNLAVSSGKTITVSKRTPTLNISTNPTSPVNYPNSITVTAALTGTYEQVTNSSLAGKTIIFDVDGNANSVEVDTSGNATYTFTPSVAKTYLIKVSYDGTSDIYNNSANSSEIFYDVEKGTQNEFSISNAPSTVIYGDNPFTLSTTGGTGTGAITYSSSNTSVLTVNVTTGDVTVVGIGDATITATKAGDSNYNIISTTTTAINVSKKDINIINADVKNKNYDGTIIAQFSGTPEISGLKSGDTVTLTNGTPSFNSKNIGSSIGINFTAFSISGTKSGNYNLTQPSGITANINKATQSTLTINNIPVTVTYGDDPFILSTTGGSGTGATTYSSSDLSILTVDGTGKVTVVGAGSATITTTKAADSNYESTSVTSAINISKKDITINSATVKDKIYDGTMTAEFSGTPELNGVVSGDTINLINGTPSFANKNVGTSKGINFTPFSINGIGVGNYNLIQPTAVVASITKKEVTISNTGVNDKKYDGNTMAGFSGTPQLNGVINGDTVTLINGIPRFTTQDAGDFINVYYTSFSMGGADSGNYSLIQPSAIVGKINKAAQSELSISNAPLDVTYGDNSFTLSTTGGSGTGEITYSSDNTSVLTVNENTGEVTIIGAGDAIITAIKAGDINYNSINETANITVNKKDITVSTSNVSIISGDSLPFFNVTIIGFVNGENETNLTGFVKPKVMQVAQDTTKVGVYPLTFSNGNPTNNYSFSPISGSSLTIIEKVNAQKPKFDKAAETVTYVQDATASALKGSAIVTDSGNVSYQWYESDGTQISKATDKTYTPSTDKTGIFYYYLVATNTNNGVNGDKIATATSNIYKVVVNKVEILPADKKDDTPTVTINDDNVFDKALTESDKNSLANGSNISIKLDVAMVEAPVNKGDESSVTSTLNGQTFGIYLDISLIKTIIDAKGEVTNDKIQETKGVIRLVIDIPENLRSTNRTFSIIRVHNGVAETLVDLDNDPNTITIETDKFSTYALAYKDEVTNTSATTNGTTTTTTTATKTGDNTPVKPLALFAIVSLFVGVNIFRKGKYKEAIKK